MTDLHVARAQAIGVAAVVLIGSVLTFSACSSSSGATDTCANAALDDGELGIDCGGTCSVLCGGAACVDDVRIAAGDEPWMDLHGNVHEAVLDMNGATFTDKFGLKYRGIGYSSARAIGNPTALTYPEYGRPLHAVQVTDTLRKKENRRHA